VINASGFSGENGFIAYWSEQGKLEMAFREGRCKSRWMIGGRGNGGHVRAFNRAWGTTLGAGLHF